MSRLNVLLYNGSGVSQASRDHCLSNLKSFLSHSYDVQYVSPKSLREDPWTDSCALLVFPGGRDLPYQYDLSGVANKRIKTWVENGGKYLGFCAGAYYASSRVEFEVGTELEVVGDRELQFFPGICSGTTFPGFAYETEEGAREVKLDLARSAWRDNWSQSPETVEVWYNGGGSFILEEENKKMKDTVEVLARYGDLDHKPVAGVRCTVGKGTAVLWAVHPEHPTLFSASDSSTLTDYPGKEQRRQALLRATLAMLELDVLDLPAPPPQLCPLFLTSPVPNLVSQIVQSISTKCIPTDSTLLPTVNTPSIQLKDRNDTVILHPPYSNDDSTMLAKSIRARLGSSDPEVLRTTPKEIIPFPSFIPDVSQTPLFDLQYYFDTLKSLVPSSNSPFGTPFGNVLLYSEAITSTQTILDKNDKFLSCLPPGLITLASHQLSGRGRSSNSWISSAGCLQFSLLLRLPLSQSRKIVFLQYLFGLAVVQAVRTKEGYEKVGIRVKWPNDLYGEVGGEGGELRKVGGILVNSSFAGDEFSLVVGCGVNTSNRVPSTSINELIRLHNQRTGSTLEPFRQEELLARIIAQFTAMWEPFLKDGFEPFVDLYLERWIHSNQKVTIEKTQQVVKIIGITPEHGLLRTVPVDLDRNGKEVFGGGGGVGRQTFIDLQPDGNGFDMIKGLLVAR